MILRMLMQPRLEASKKERQRKRRPICFLWHLGTLRSFPHLHRNFPSVPCALKRDTVQAELDIHVFLAGRRLCRRLQWERVGPKWVQSKRLIIKSSKTKKGKHYIPDFGSMYSCQMNCLNATTCACGDVALGTCLIWSESQLFFFLLDNSKKHPQPG